MALHTFGASVVPFSSLTATPLPGVHLLRQAGLTGCVIDNQDEDGLTPLTSAVAANKLAVAAFLLAKWVIFSRRTTVCAFAVLPSDGVILVGLVAPMQNSIFSLRPARPPEAHAPLCCAACL